MEVIVACPLNWHLTPVECLSWIEERVIAEFPLGEFKDETGGGKSEAEA